MDETFLDKTASHVVGQLFDFYFTRLKYEPASERQKSAIDEISVFARGLDLQKRLYLASKIQDRITELSDVNYRGFEAELKVEAARDLGLVNINCSDSRPIPRQGLHIYDLEATLKYQKA